MDKIEFAETFAQEFGKDGVIIFHLDDNRLGYVSYGKDKQWCYTMKRIADGLWRAFGRQVLKHIPRKENGGQDDEAAAQLLE